MSERAIRGGACAVMIAAHLCSLIGAGCVSAGRYQTSASAVSEAATDAGEFPPVSRTSTLTRTDFMSANFTSTFEAIRRLRPEFLFGSGRSSSLIARPEVAVYLNDLYAGDVLVLNTIPLDAVREVVFLHPIEAAIRFGSACRCASGVIAVHTRPPRDK